MCRNGPALERFLCELAEVFISVSGGSVLAALSLVQSCDFVRAWRRDSASLMPQLMVSALTAAGP